MSEIKFLSLAEIIIIHKNQITLYGGDDGLRDISLLSSAAAMPESSFESNYLHENIYEMAAAYAFHICQNYPFVDGNKRTAFVAALIFLDLNNIELKDDNNELYNSMMLVASGKMDKLSLSKVI